MVELKLNGKRASPVGLEGSYVGPYLIKIKVWDAVVLWLQRRNISYIT